MPEVIRSLQNPRIKRAVRLRDAGFRRETGLMIVDGERELKQAVEGDFAIEEIFVVEDAKGSGSHLGPSFLKTARGEPIVVSFEVMEKLSYGDRRESVVAIVEQPSLDLARFEIAIQDQADSQALFLVIDSVEKPGNLGAMLRTADAVGVTGVILTDPVCEIWNPNAIRAGMGAGFRLPLAVAGAEEAVRWLHRHGVKIWAARVQASQELPAANFGHRSAIVVGSEAEGLGRAWVRPDIEGIRLPMKGSVDSLNVSVSAAVLLYHAADRMGWFLRP